MILEPVCWQYHQLQRGEELSFVMVKLYILSSAQGRTALSLLRYAEVAALKTPPQTLPRRPRPNVLRLHLKGQMETSPPQFPPQAALERPGRRSTSRLNWKRGRGENLCWIWWLLVGRKYTKPLINHHRNYSEHTFLFQFIAH